MEIESKAMQVRISARKVRLVAKTLKGLKPIEAMHALKFLNKKAAPLISKIIKSAMSDATNNFKLKEDNLRIKKVIVEDGSILKRFRARSRGMANSIKKRSSHVKVTLEEVN